MLRPNVLRRTKDFQALYNKGKSVGERYLVVFYRKNQCGFGRTAFLASKKVGKSVQRNRARRLMKESYRELSDKLLPGYDIIFIARKNMIDSRCADVKKSMEAALKKARIYQ